MTPSNLPPGCNDSDIPGNRPEDEAWDRMSEELCELGLSPEAIMERVKGYPKAIALLARYRLLIRQYGLPEIGAKQWDELQAKAWDVIKSFERHIRRG